MVVIKTINMTLDTIILSLAAYYTNIIKPSCALLACAKMAAESEGQTLAVVSLGSIVDLRRLFFLMV